MHHITPPDEQARFLAMKRELARLHSFLLFADPQACFVSASHAYLIFAVSSDLSEHSALARLAPRDRLAAYLDLARFFETLDHSGMVALPTLSSDLLLVGGQFLTPINFANWRPITAIPSELRVELREMDAMAHFILRNRDKVNGLLAQGAHTRFNLCWALNLLLVLEKEAIKGGGTQDAALLRLLRNLANIEEKQPLNARIDRKSPLCWARMVRRIRDSLRKRQV